MQTDYYIYIFTAVQVFMVIYITFSQTRRKENELRDLMEIIYRNNERKNFQNEDLVITISKLQANLESFTSFQSQIQKNFEENRYSSRSFEKIQAKMQDSMDEMRYTYRDVVRKLDESIKQTVIFSNHDLLTKIDEINSKISHQVNNVHSVGLDKASEQRQEELLALVKKVSSEFSHSIKTPLSSIKSATTNISKQLIPAIQDNSTLSKNSEILISLLENAQTSIEYIEKILERGAGFLPGKTEKFKINDAIKKAVRITKEGALSPINIKYDLGDIPEIENNWFNIFMALIQILENAFEAQIGNENGLIEITSAVNEEKNKIEVTILNGGAPISKENYDKIFESSFSTKGTERGLGLGIAKKCLEEVGGSVELMNSNENATSFKITLSL